MKHLKTYENINKPQEGDYVVLKINVSPALSYYKEINNFINNTIGKVIRVKNNIIVTTYTDVPKGVINYFTKKYDNYGNIKYTREFDTNRINIIGSTIEDVEMKINTNKFNI